MSPDSISSSIGRLHPSMISPSKVNFKSANDFPILVETSLIACFEILSLNSAILSSALPQEVRLALHKLRERSPFDFEMAYGTSTVS